jgi:DNA modification methylase
MLDIPKLFHGDFRDVCPEHVPDNSINLIFTDLPYSRRHLPLYQPLGIEAFQMLKEGGHLVTYAPQYALPEIFDSMENSELTWWWQIMVKHTGRRARMFSKHVDVTYKPLLWFVKGKPKILGFFEDSVESQPPDKSLHPWTRSTVEAEYVISKFTFENDVVLDPAMGTGTTGIAALKLNRRFLGIERNADMLAIANGKSPVAIATTLTLGSSYILTSTKNLQTQYAMDFPFVRVAKGKNNFRCEVKDDFIKNDTFR